MPGSHNKHVDNKANGRAGQPGCEPFPLYGQHHETGKDKVPEPEGQGHVPSVPEILHINTDKRLVEVFRYFDSQDITGAYGHRAVARKVEEHVDAVAVAIARIFQKALRILKKHHALMDQCRQNEFINNPY